MQPAVSTSISFSLCFTPLFLSYLLSSSSPSLPPTAPTSSILKSFNLILGGLTIAVVATLNFGASIALSLILCLPLTLAKPRERDVHARVQQLLLLLVSPPSLWGLWRLIDDVGADSWLRSMLVSLSIEGGWSLGIGMYIVVPLILQAATAALI